jgi:hypothetical protein
MSESTEDDLTETGVDGFADFMKFIANNNLWDEAKAALAADGVEVIRVSSRPIRVIRKMIDEEIIASHRLDDANHRHALVISECHCGVGNPGPPGGAPQFPTGGGDAGVPSDAGTTPTTLPE